MVAVSGANVVVIEPGTTFGLSGERHRAATAHGGQTLSIHWTANHDVIVLHARDGVLVAMFDPFDPQAAASDDHDLLREWMARTPIGPSDWLAQTITAGADLTGIVVDKEWLDREHATVRLDPTIGAITPQLRLAAHEQAFLSRDPQVAELVSRSSARSYPAVPTWRSSRSPVSPVSPRTSLYGRLSP